MDRLLAVEAEEWKDVRIWNWIAFVFTVLRAGDLPPRNGGEVTHPQNSKDKSDTIPNADVFPLFRFNHQQPIRSSFMFRGPVLMHYNVVVPVVPCL